MLANLLLPSRASRREYEPEQPPVSPGRKNSLMATLLNYSFTASSRSSKESADLERAALHQYSHSHPSLPALKSPAFVRSSPESPLPPIPRTEPLSIPHLEAAAAAAKRRSRATSSSAVAYGKASALRRADSKLGRPPRSVAISPDDSYIEQPPVFTATVWAPSRGYPAAASSSTTSPLSSPPLSPSVPRIPNRGLHESSDRIQKILKTKQMGGLHIDQSHLDAGITAGRGSAATTPTSPYGPRSSSLRAHMDVAPLEQQIAITPIAVDLGALEVIANTPDPALEPRRRPPPVKSAWRESMCSPSTRNSVMAVELPGGSVMTVITPEQSAWQRAPYVPGAIRMEPRTKAERSPLTIIQETVNAELGLDKERSAAEQVIVDELVDFIESFGEAFTVKETGLDAYWVDSQPMLLPLRLSNAHLSPWSSAHLSPWSTATTLVHSPPATGAPRLSGWDLPDDWKDHFNDLHEPDFKTRDALLPGGSVKRASFASSQYSGSSRTASSTHNSLAAYSPPSPVKHNQHQYHHHHPYEISTSPLHSPSTSNLHLPLPGALPVVPRKVRQVKGKGAPSVGQKMSLRGLLRSATSIV